MSAAASFPVSARARVPALTEPQVRLFASLSRRPQAGQATGLRYQTENGLAKTTVTVQSEALVWLGDSPFTLLTLLKKTLSVGGGLASGIKAFIGW